MVKCLLQAERDARLPKLVGGVWHPYRRKWAMERKHWPIRDVAAVGGWKCPRSLVECYAQSDRETMRAVVNEPRKLLSTDLQPSQLATREPWSPPADRPHRRCAPGNRRRCTPQRDRVPRGAMHGSESSTPGVESSTATS
jgi:hypothetical protein